MLTHIHPLPFGLPVRLGPALMTRSTRLSVRNRSRPKPAKCPGPLCPPKGVTSCGVTSRITYYPSLIAPTGPCARPNPSHRLRSMPWSAGLCRSPSAPAERWPFPALSLQSLRRCLDPYPEVLPWCTCSLLPRRHRPHPDSEEFGTPDHPCNATSTGTHFSRSG